MSAAINSAAMHLERDVFWLEAEPIERLAQAVSGVVGVDTRWR
jgi:hypothetical protein